MKITAIIPARYASSRFEGKPLAKIAGKPMIQMVCERAEAASHVHQAVVATDDRRIYDAVKGFGGHAIMTSEAHRSGTDRVAEAAEILGLSGSDIVVNIQGDQPLMDPRSLDDLVRPFLKDPKVYMSTLAFKIVNKREITDPKDCKVTFDKNGDALYFSRSQIPFARDEGTAFDVYKHLGFYAYTKTFLEQLSALPPSALEEIEKLEQLRVLENGYKIRVAVTSYDSPEVDLPIDIARMEEIIKNA